MKNKRMRLLSSALAITLVTSLLAPISISAEKSQDIDPVTEISAAVASYNEYLANVGKTSPAKADIILDTEATSFDEDITLNPEYKGKPALVWEKGTGSATWTVDVPTDAYYNVILSYASVTTGVDYSFSLSAFT